MGKFDWLQEQLEDAANVLPDDIPVRPTLGILLDFWADATRSRMNNPPRHPFLLLDGPFNFPFNPLNATDPAVWGRIAGDPSLAPTLLLNDPGAAVLVRNVAKILNGPPTWELERTTGTTSPAPEQIIQNARTRIYPMPRPHGGSSFGGGNAQLTS